MKRSKVYIALLHYPMYNKNMDIITTSITNLDLHDIARAARTYDVEGFFIVHPSPNQHKLAGEILAYWQEGHGGKYNNDRQEAFRLLRLVEDLPAVTDAIERETGKKAVVVATDARPYANTVGYRDLRSEIFNTDKAYLILFGTGWGIARHMIDQCDRVLVPILGSGDYNHLSVRSAVSIILDRLLGEAWYNI